MATKERLEQALRGADKAGDVIAAKRFAAAIRNGEYEATSNDVPVYAPGETPNYTPDQPQMPEPGILDKGIAGAKALGVMAGNAIPATIGAIGGSVYGAGKEILGGAPQGSGQEYIAQGAQALSPFSTNDPLANQYMQNAGEALGSLDPGFIGRAAKGATLSSAAARDASQVAKQGATQAKKSISELPQAIKSAVSTQDDSARSMGAAEADTAAMRREMAAQLPVDPKLTEGQATRNFNQQRFENEAMKGELGQPLRERAAAQHQAIRQSFDEFIDQTGAQAPDIRATGIAVSDAIRGRAARDKNEIRSAYRQAEKSGELQEGVSTKAIIDTLNNSISSESTAPILVAARKELLRLGGAVEDKNGNLIEPPKPEKANISKSLGYSQAKNLQSTPDAFDLSKSEQLRKFINKNTGYEPTNIAFSSDLKSAIDSATEGKGGDLYKRARGLYSKYANQYENRAVIEDVVKNKLGTADRRVALEDVADRILFRGSLDDAKHVRKVLQNAGEDGQQAWKELQGAGLKYIRDEATKNVARDVNGQEMISPAALHKAINRLDTDGKLDALYGKNGAEKIRNINEISKVLFTSPPGAVNHSNTAGVMMALLDTAISGSAGLPLPIATTMRYTAKNIKDRKMKAKIQAALGSYKEAEK